MKCKSKFNNRNAGLQRYTDIKQVFFLYSIYTCYIWCLFWELSCLFSPMYNHQYWWNIV